MPPIGWVIVGAFVGAALGVVANWVTKPKWAEDHPGVLLVVIAVLALAGALVAGKAGDAAGDKAVASTGQAANAGVIRFIGGCSPFSVFSQNRWVPLGTAVRSGPTTSHKQIANRDPNQLITVDGWVHSSVAYPTNAAPWNNDIWFHLADGAGWVSFAGVRATPTYQDPTLRGDGGTPAPTDPACQGSAQ